MNPVGILVIAMGILLIIVGIKGTQHKIVASLTNKPAASQ